MNGQTFFVVFKFFSQNNILESGNVIYLATILTLDFTLCGKAVMRKVVFRMIDQFMFLFWIIGYGVFTKGNVKSGSPLIEYKGELIHCNEGITKGRSISRTGLWLLHVSILPWPSRILVCWTRRVQKHPPTNWILVLVVTGFQFRFQKMYLLFKLLLYIWHIEKLT